MTREGDGLDYAEREGFHVVGSSRAARLAAWAEKKDEAKFRRLCKTLLHRRWKAAMAPEKRAQYDARARARKVRDAAREKAQRAAARAALEKACANCGADVDCSVVRPGYTPNYCSRECYLRVYYRERYRRERAAGPAARSRCGVCREAGHNRSLCPQIVDPRTTVAAHRCSLCRETGHNRRGCPRGKGRDQ